jgi:hypothetical protein
MFDDKISRAMYYNDRSPRDEMVGTDAASYRASDAAVAAAAAQPPPGYVYAQMQPQQQLHQQPQQQLHQQPQHQQPQQQLQQQPQHQQPQQQLQQQPQPQLQQQQQLQQQPQQQLQQQPPPQQPAPQQIVTAGNQHFIHNPATGTFIPPQQQQTHAFDPHTGMFYVPMRPNAPQQYSMPPGAGAPMPPPPLVDSTPKPTTVPIPQQTPQQTIPQQYMKPELQQPAMYRTAAPAAPVPGTNTAPAYAGMGYHHVIQPHLHPAQQPATTMAGNYGYEYADPRAQVFYSQAGAPPASLPPQYQPMGSPDAGQADLNQNRAS